MSSDRQSTNLLIYQFTLLLTTLLIFLLAFGAVWLLERTVHRTLQSIALITTGHVEAATVLYAVPLFPGVALHELSHAVMATVLGVKVRDFSLWPKRQAGGIRLGCVEILRTDAVRASFIGAAPLFFGSAALIAIGLYVFNSSALVQRDWRAGDVSAFAAQILATVSAPDALLWFYLVFAIANSMMPSPSDTQSWPPVIGFLVVAVGGASVDWRHVRHIFVGGIGTRGRSLCCAGWRRRLPSQRLSISSCSVCCGYWHAALEAMTGKRIEYKR